MRKREIIHSKNALITLVVFFGLYVIYLTLQKILTPDNSIISQALIATAGFFILWFLRKPIVKYLKKVI